MLKSGLILAVLFAGVIAAPPSAVGWKEFHSSKGFALMYPGDWFRQNISPEQLDILSSKGHREAVVIEKGEAFIFVKEEPRSSGKTLAEVVRHYAQGTAPLSDRDVLISGRGSCDRLREVVWKEPPVPPEDVPAHVHLTDFVYTSLFCQVGDRTVVLILKNWDGDTHQAQYKHIALDMAKSIRIPCLTRERLPRKGQGTLR
jgi:hypothetical protein